MDFPFGHHNNNNQRHHHNNNRRRDDDDYDERREDYPPNYQQQPPPPPSVTHHSHTPPPNYGGGGDEFGQPEAHGYGGYGSGYPSVQHVSHQSHNPPNFGHHEPQYRTSGGSEVFPDNRPTVKIYSKAEIDYSLTVRDGQVVLAPSNPRDDLQHWIKDDKWSTRVKDEEGHPCFALVNKATGQAIKHSFAATQPVQLIPYNPNAFDESILWTESKDLGDSYRCIRMVNNIRLNLDAFNGDKNHGGVRDGTIAVLWEWKKGDNQRWKIAHY